MLEVYDNIAWESDDDKHKPDKVLEALENYCNPRDNEVLVGSQRFWNTQYQEPFDKFLTELKTATCIIYVVEWGGFFCFSMKEKNVTHPFKPIS